MATSKPTTMPPRGPLPTRSGGIGRILRPLLMILVLLLVAAASAGATWFIAQRMQPQGGGAPVQLGVGQTGNQPGQPGAAGPQATPTTFVAPPTTPAAVPAPIFVPIEAFTVTLQNADTERIMHVGLTLRVSDEQTRIRLEKYMPEVRSRILMVLSSQSPTGVQTQQGKTDMANAIKQAVNRPFAPLPDGQYVTDVLYTAFVVQ
ncbi:flagellar basal body-associated FliL family protein [Achromobacter xylosoxidans]|uniref:Flagellar protein FliL n=2 Tax=Alcaligenes xylosoxydans xylosoxydans TaxID=85698 RepID=A0A9X3R883_ALCXX|nr:MULTISPECIES: flagellar basal body-associated FliL family protein [Achromobacter]AUZ20055.1 flagellar basal body-associated protein FliL [Achromobacter xylosoxidans]AXA77443.1 flagellar basal body-associated protein FliL [Achromobacter xylosoxidans]KMJ89162.1 flagellar basal body protein FliL [Achromobacter xylosoxidans]KOQ19913.1 flagellar basal body protein FliL [Achromobacter xylosoxidans]KOQ23028.1 flagellar basal body protein FliL [Achromobacter xylosoxidans]